MSDENILERVDPAFGNWLAGFADGEGCFRISRARRGTESWSYSCLFSIGLRADDAAVLEEIQGHLGIGDIRHEERARKNWAPMVKWTVRRKADVVDLVTVFKTYPLRAKKAQDFEIWRQAVDLWMTVQNRGYGGVHPAQVQMEALADELRYCRTFRLTGHQSTGATAPSKGAQ